MSDEPLELDTSNRPPAGAERRPAPNLGPCKPRFEPVAPERPTGSVVLKLILLGLLGAAIYGGYHVYCSYKCNDKFAGFSEAALDLYNELMRLEKTIRTDDIRQVVERLAKQAQVTPVPGTLVVSIEPLTDTSAEKLPPVAKMGLGMAAKISNHKTPTWVVGFAGKFAAKHGIVRQTFEFKRYTYFEWAQP